MHRSRSFELLPLDLEIERTLQGIRATRRNEIQDMVDNNHQQRAIQDYIWPVVNDNYSGIARQTIGANNFELKPTLISMVQQNQFGGSPLEDPNVHLPTFLEICSIVKMNNVSEDTIRLRLFPLSLRDKARGWLQSLQSGTITTWDSLVSSFLFPNLLN